ncbi:NACHT domain-containing protein [Amycolatopsis sp. NPDC004625]|uniref:NACHT domain-containing protein n=1 Tax=Amycolatopsis sp. NPDC004625 TaxID=3154670 RepID=UPI0033A77BF0
MRVVIVLAGFALISGAVYFGLFSLDNADKVASVVAAVFGILLSMSGLFYRLREKSDEARRKSRYNNFARHLISILDSLANKEDWRDEIYTELEAQVEMEGRRRSRWIRGRRQKSIRRVKSLSIALERSGERQILLVGEPGAGKSFAMRHVAYRMALRARRNRRSIPVVPLYVNLKSFRPAGAVDARAVREFVMSAVNQGNSAVDEFLGREFDRGIEEGNWLFLFDAFDEIPAILSSTEADSTVELYAQAIQGFLSTMSNCRGVLASRDFRGPHRLGWPRFSVVRLDARRQKNLIRRMDLPESVEQQLLHGLANADTLMVELAGTPLFLNLICEYVKVREKFPDNPHLVFDRYVSSRLSRDSSRFAQRFGVTSVEVRRVAEQISFHMSASLKTGLEVDRTLLVEYMSLPADKVEKAIDALVYSKLAATVDDQPGVQKITFAHRRVQEYFSTCVVLRQPDLVSNDQLLTDQNWREAAVTILQTQERAVVQPLLDAACDFIVKSVKNEPEKANFSWPPGLLHVFSLLVAGLGGARAEWLDYTLSVKEIARVLNAAWSNGRRYDKKWALESAGLLRDKHRTQLLNKAFSVSSSMLREEAYRQTGRMSRVPVELRSNLLRGLVTQWADGQLRQQLSVTRAWLTRVDGSDSLSKSLNLLIALPSIDAILSVGVGLIIFLMAESVTIFDGSSMVPIIIGLSYVVLSRLSLMMMVASPAVSWAATSKTIQIIQKIRSMAQRLTSGKRSRDSLWSGVSVRLIMAFGAISIIIIAHGADVYLKLLLILGVVIASTWTIFALEGVIAQEPVNPILWPVLPVVITYRAGARQFGQGKRASVARRAGGDPRKSIYRSPSVRSAYQFSFADKIVGFVIVTIQLLPFAGAAVLFGLLVALISSWLGMSSEPKESDRVISVIVLIMFAVLALLALVIAAVAALQWAKRVVADFSAEKKAKAVVAGIRGVIGHEQIVGILTVVRSDQVLRETVISLRKKGVLSISPEAVQTLADLGALAESLNRTNGVFLNRSNTPSTLVGWMYPKASKSASGVDQERLRFTRSLSEATMDEIARVVIETKTQS